MSAAHPNVDYLACARRHIKDACILLDRKRTANSGQLFGFSVECGLKALLVRTGVAIDPEGNILKTTGYREHLPKLGQLINSLMVLPDGRSASLLQSHLPSLKDMDDWKIDHRYWRTSAIPLAVSLGKWEMAALEVDALLDDVISKGMI